MTNLTKVLKKLEKEGYRVNTELDIESHVEFLGEADLLAGRENFKINYNKAGKFQLEITWSNQIVTDEWMKKVTKLRSIIKS